MNTYAKTLAELLDTLPFELHDEVRDFVELLLMKHQRRPGAKLRQDWGVHYVIIANSTPP